MVCWRLIYDTGPIIVRVHADTTYLVEYCAVLVAR